MNASSTVERRDPSVVMRLKRLGSFHQCRLSFMLVYHALGKGMSIEFMKDSQCHSTAVPAGRFTGRDLMLEQ
jgi:hypothetical protein